MKKVCNPPFIVCPYCGKKTFGISEIFSHYYTRKCSRCFYPNPERNEPEVRYRLPYLSKKIIYLDQFALSYMVRVMHPDLRATGNHRADDFWVQLYKKLDRLVKLQIIICPQSSFHLQESVVSNFFESLEKMYHLLSRGFSFIQESQIRKKQFENSVKNWIWGISTKSTADFLIKDVINGDINSWLPREIQFSPSNYSLDYEYKLRRARKRIHQQWIDEFYIWKEHSDAKFEQWVEDFYLSLTKNIFSNYSEYMKGIIAFPKHQISDIKLCDFLLDSINPIKLIHSIFQNEGIGLDDLWLNTWLYFQSESFQQIPFIKLYALFYASFARKAGSGQKKPPDRGMTNDLNILSLLLPYCDAMFIDNQCHACLEEQDVRSNFDFSTKVFSLNNKEKFLEYLEKLENNFPIKYRKKTEELYGTDYINIPTKLY